jgi:hypothetical protein
MVAIKRAIEPYERQKAKERQLSGKPLDNLSEGGNTLDKISGFVGDSRFNLKKAEDSRFNLKKAEDIVKAAEQSSRTRV